MSKTKENIIKRIALFICSLVTMSVLLYIYKQVQISCMGTIKKELKQNPKVLVVESSFPSTQICPVCGEKTPHSLDKRIYKCKHCGHEHPNRDIKAAETLLNEGINRLFGTKSDVKQSPMEAISNTNSNIVSNKSPMI